MITEITGSIILLAIALTASRVNKLIALNKETNAMLQKLLEQKHKNTETKASEPYIPTDQTSLNDPKVMEILLNKLNKTD